MYVWIPLRVCTLLLWDSDMFQLAEQKLPYTYYSALSTAMAYLCIASTVPSTVVWWLVS
jgi:hypothetical protein